MSRVVLDTNVLVSAVISQGKPRELFRMGISNVYIILTSDWMLRELVSVLRRPKFKTSEDEIRGIVSDLMQSSEIVQVQSSIDTIKEDPDDNHILATAIDGMSDYIVSGDKHLLELKQFKGIKIVSVDEMLKILKEQ